MKGDPIPPSRARKLDLKGVTFDALTEQEVVDTVFTALAAGVGGHLLTPNVDILLRLQEPRLQKIVESADLVVADGAPLVWASRLQGTGLPTRVTGADLIWSLTDEAARRGARVFLFGGGPGIAELAGTRLRERNPDIDVVGTHSPPYGFEPDAANVAAVSAQLAETPSDLVFIGLGFPKQDLLAAELREAFPQTWFVGCGAALDFVAGRVSRAPRPLQNMGLEWVYRLLQEPRRLARRYLRDDLPFAARLLGSSLLVWVASSVRRLRSRSAGPRG